LRGLAFLILLSALVLGPMPAPTAEAATIEVPCDPVQLIAALNSANSSAGPDTLYLAPKCTYTLAEVDNETNGPNGLPSISSAITVNGNGAIIERSSDAGTPEFRILHVAEGGELELNRLTIRHSSWAGGIENDAGHLTIRDSLLDGSEGNFAVHNEGGTVTIVRSRVRNSQHDPALENIQGTLIVNTSVVDGNASGGIVAYGGSVEVLSSRLSNNSATFSAGSTGGVYVVDGTLSIRGSIITGNSATEGGGGIHSKDSTLSVANTIVTGNSAPDSLGGGIRIIATYGHTAEIVHSIVTKNTASQGGGIWSNGAVSVTGSRIADNEATASGGGLYALAGSLDVTRSSVRDNTANEAGGLYNREAEVTLTQCTIDGNRGVPGGGGGVLNWHDMTLVDSTVSRNLGQDAGGVMNLGTLRVINSTISDNDGGQGSCGAICNGGSLYLTSTTISGNRTEGSGNSIDSFGPVIMVNTILVGEKPGFECYGSGYTSLGYNLGSDNTCGLDQPTDQPNTAALLGPLQRNGGPTETHALLAGSPAMDQGSCPDQTADQRGMPRPVDLARIPNADDGCDIGAFEAVAPFQFGWR
jgi:predicted outer membrane repeat protein